MSYTPKNNFNLQLKRTDAGEVGFRKKLLADVACCNDPHYQFYSDFNEEALDPGSSMTITVKGGCSPFAWSVSGSDFTLTNANTEGRENTISSAFDTGMSIREIVTVTDACSNTTEIIVTNCGLFSDNGDIYTGVLWGWGDNSHDSLGSDSADYNPDPINIDEFIRIGILNVGFFHSMSITRQALLESVGNGEFGKLGLGDTSKRVFFTSVDGNRWIRVSLGYWSSLALRLDGSLYGCGWNHYGELGIGDQAQRNTFAHIVDNVSRVSTDRFHSLIVKTNGTLWAAGKGSYGALGLGDDLERISFTQVGSEVNWSKVFVGSYDSFALTNAGVLYGTGWNNNGVLGIGDEVQRGEFTLIPGIWKSMSIGEDTSMGIKSTGTLWVAGDNRYGQLGLGDTTKRISFTQVGSATNWKMCAVSRMGNSCFALQDNGNLYSSGENSMGTLGLGDYNNRDEFTQIPGSWNAIIPGGLFTFGIKNE